ncbi:phage tail tube protein [Fibrella forsythiae]|uniref:Phage tail protein n=1 Tax=Fibrella forsythiae TaxID=2817061 RepID=A0ABS3JF32_9BACT|nr:phage tail tube protein [Fibrella forsythiae]MBO0947522.1 hypothetical protein [Fibrella forsythiae]
MSAFNASNMLVAAYLGSPATKKTVAKQTDLTFDESAGDIDISNKQSGRYGESLAGRLSGTIDFEAFIETAPGAGEASIADVRAVFVAGTAIKWAIASTISGTESTEVFGYITKFTRKYTQETGAAYSISIKITGAPTVTMVA